MEYRQLGGSGFKVPVLSLGTGTFGGGNEFFKAWGTRDVAEATRLVDICLDAGLNMFDSADIYSSGLAEEILGAGDQGPPRPGDHLHQGHVPRRRRPERRRLVALSPDPGGRSEPAAARHRLHRPLSAARLRRADAGRGGARARSTISCRAGKIRYIGCSNFSGWHLMKSLAVSEKYGLARYVAHQAYYSLIGRDYEWELMPLALDQKVGAVVWSPLGWGRLTGKIRRGQPLPETSRLQSKAVDRHRPAGRRRVPLSASSTRSTRSPRKPARPCRRSRSTGCCSGRPWRTSSSARATRSSSARTSGAVGWNLTPEQVAQARRGQRRRRSPILLAPARLRRAKPAAGGLRGAAFESDRPISAMRRYNWSFSDGHAMKS